MFADDVTVIGVAGRADQEPIEAFVAEQNVGGFDHIVDLDTQVWREYGITSQPAFAFLNDDGTVESRIGAFGFEELADRVQELVES